MLDYKPNSNKFKSEQKSAQQDRENLPKVIKGTARTVKKSEMRKFADSFIVEDISNVGEYIVKDVFIPTIKKTIFDIITNGIDMLLYGTTGRSNKNSIAGKVSYRNYYDQRNSDRGYSSSSYNKPRTPHYSYDEIVLDSRGEAEEVLMRMQELIEQYKMASVADLYDLVGVSGDYTDNKYGWINLRNADVIRVRDGYLLKLPKALPLDR